MNKKLPNIFVSKQNNKINNNKELYYSLDDVNKMINDDKNTSLFVRKKINDIFESPNFIYKSDVKIETKDNGNITATIISRTNHYLLTIDNKKIRIDDILDIKEIKNWNNKVSVFI